MILDDAKEAFDFQAFTRWGVRIFVGIITLIMIMAVLWA